MGKKLMGNSDTGEHISNEKNELEYIPFPTCNETGKPLELQYGIEEGTSFPALNRKREGREKADIQKHRTQLHNPLHNRPLLPPPRILHSQRRPPLLPHPLSSPTHPPRRPHPATPRIRTPDLRSSRDITTLALTYLDPFEYPLT